MRVWDLETAHALRPNGYCCFVYTVIDWCVSAESQTTPTFSESMTTQMTSGSLRTDPFLPRATSQKSDYTHLELMRSHLSSHQPCTHSANPCFFCGSLSETVFVCEHLILQCFLPRLSNKQFLNCIRKTVFPLHLRLGTHTHELTCIKTIMTHLISDCLIDFKLCILFGNCVHAVAEVFRSHLALHLVTPEVLSREGM